MEVAVRPQDAYDTYVWSSYLPEYHSRWSVQTRADRHEVEERVPSSIKRSSRFPCNYQKFENKLQVPRQMLVDLNSAIRLFRVAQG